MGTKSLTVIKNNEDKEICVMYKQFDGYPEGHGQELYEFLNGMTIVNGIGMNHSLKLANGMECLTAQIIAHFKKDVGGIYVYPNGTRDCYEDYIYTVYFKYKKLYMTIFDCCNKTILFDGELNNFSKWLIKYKEE